VERADQPELHGQVFSSLLVSDVLQDVLVVHLRQVVDLLLGVPRVLVLLVAAFPDGPEPSPGLDLEQFDVPELRIRLSAGILVSDKSSGLVAVRGRQLKKYFKFSGVAIRGTNLRFSYCVNNKKSVRT